MSETQRITIISGNALSSTKIKATLDKMVDIVKPTFGPANNKVIISKVTHGGVLDDGVQIVRDLEFEDPVENAILKVGREVAIKINDNYGDGTTGGLIITQSLYNEVSKIPSFDGHKIEKELRGAFEECKEQILAATKKVSSLDDLKKIARVSYDDEKISNMIAETWYELGPDGIFTIGTSGTMETVVEVSQGIKINNGYISPYMITNAERMEAVVEKPYILFTDYRLTEAGDIIPIMEKLFEKKITNLVIIADNVEQGALATLTLNKLQGKFMSIAIVAPKGDDRTQILEDMALLTGGAVFSEGKGHKLENVEIKHLGRAERIICRRDETVIIGPRGNKAVIKTSIDELRSAIENETNEKIKKGLRERAARLENKVGIIKVGAPTDNELKAVKYKVEDAVNATRAAFKGGVVCGGGLMLSRLNTSSEILNRALKAPHDQLKLNMGITSNPKLKSDEALNVVTGKIGNWYKVGVMDPAQVIIGQIETAISIVSLFITASGMIIEAPKHMKQEQ